MSGESHRMGTLGDRLREARQEKGMGQRSLARASGVSQGHISHAESGKRVELGPTVLSALADALGVSVDWLLTGEGPRERASPERTVDPAEDTSVSPFDAARTMFLAEQTHEGRGDDARAFLAQRDVHYAGAEGRSPGWWLETLKDEFRTWRIADRAPKIAPVALDDDDPFGGPTIPAINPRRRR